MTNRNDVRIICNSNKSICKTKNELIDFVKSANGSKPSWCNATVLNETEYTVCKYRKLWKLDNRLTEVYGSTKSNDRDMSQSSWLKNKRDECYTDVYCIKRAYENRISYLQGQRDNKAISKKEYSSSQKRKTEDIKLSYIGGVYHTPVIVNDSVRLDFVVDTGAALVSIPRDVYKTLRRTGTLPKSEFIAVGEFTIANGESMKELIVNIRELKIGNQIIHNVKASVVNSENASLLLGQSALRKLEPWSLNTKKRVLTIGSHSSASNSHATKTTYRVINISGDNTLNVRSSPYVTDDNIISELMPYTNNIQVITCRRTSNERKWCKVTHSSIPTGWVSARYLEKE